MNFYGKRFSVGAALTGSGSSHTRLFQTTSNFTTDAHQAGFRCGLLTDDGNVDATAPVSLQDEGDGGGGVVMGWLWVGWMGDDG